MTAAAPGLHPDWIVPDWPAPAGVRALCTTRVGGVSYPPYDSLNLGSHVGDAPAQVQQNRETLQRAIGHPPFFVEQIHGTDVLELSGLHAAATGIPVADAAWTAQRLQVCTVMVADCLPVLLCSRDGSWVAAVHAGWRGLAGRPENGGKGILEHVLESFSAVAQVKPARVATDLIAWLGPCIGPQKFEVGSEVRAAFMASPLSQNDGKTIQACFSPQAGEKWWADLSGLARLRLAALGVSAIYGNDGSLPWCTASNPLRFFSHRRDRVSGRMAACIWRD